MKPWQYSIRGILAFTAAFAVGMWIGDQKNSWLVKQARAAAEGNEKLADKRLSEANERMTKANEMWDQATALWEQANRWSAEANVKKGAK